MLEHMKDKISNDESFVPAGIFAAMEKVTEGEAALQAKDAEIEARDAALQQVEQEKAQMEDEKAQMEDKMRERESSLKKQMAEENTHIECEDIPFQPGSGRQLKQVSLRTTEILRTTITPIGIARRSST